MVEPSRSKWKSPSRRGRSVSSVDDLNVAPELDVYDLLWRQPSEGQVRFGAERLVLFYASSYQALVRALVDTSGPKAAQDAVMRMGYTAGTNVVEMQRTRKHGGRTGDSFREACAVLTAVGVAKTGAIKVEFVVEQGRFEAETTWTQSLDSEFYLSHFGLSATPACHGVLGYLDACASALMGVPVAFREVECQACGHEACRAVGRTVTDWGEDAASLDYLRSHDIINGFATANPGQLDAGDRTELVGASPGFNSAFQLVERVAPTDVDVLFLGETGVGKELFARALHRLSGRRDGPFVTVNCAALPENLVEAELFGVERGAYTGATRSRAGRFERADGGVLFLDEIGTLSYVSQSKLLRVVQTREVERVGDDRTRRVDVRVVTATNEDMEAAVREGRFREDLYYRLSTFPVRIPPLRERRDDIPLLISHFLTRFKHTHGRRVPGFTNAAVQALMRHPYSGNVRELEQIIERAVILTVEGHPVDVGQLFFRSGALAQHSTVGFTLRDSGREREMGAEYQTTTALEGLLDQRYSLTKLNDTFVELAIRRSHGNVAQAARLLGVSRAQLDYRLHGRKRRRPSA
jgi:two-component system, NtrC family, response regulator HydG